MDKILAWKGSVSIDRVGQGFDFERVSKVDDVYIFFNGPQIYGIYDKNGNYIKRTYRYNTDTDVTVEVIFKELVNPKTVYFDYIFASILMIGAATILFLYSDKRQKTID